MLVPARALALPQVLPAAHNTSITQRKSSSTCHLFEKKIYFFFKKTPFFSPLFLERKKMFSYSQNHVNCRTAQQDSTAGAPPLELPAVL
jgi:hypothetical protein